MLFVLVPLLRNFDPAVPVAGVLAPPTLEDTRDERQRAFWEVTQESVDRFLPGMIDESALPIAASASASASPAPADPATHDQHLVEVQCAEVPAAAS
ncbi:hypothetical protein PUNSTDRAFT_132638 [Punctularia strigosozonata HHB-11173 SS5]|uniref:uncharacterized protein n=1 Tax=Punctularia strigosozonata (strain HHB-11173) TaxID=741275 RepID=UPI0004416739|nr:uncharacterized protein PUNSTDRAFT_132638 [Punctularia strigosozonata HHB-11173 SS5]EIN10548.1 hypothetical protein PUNSTDRAFT_132638 [Punctularia strigosozonata HHB-11173 SS5]